MALDGDIASLAGLGLDVVSDACIFRLHERTRDAASVGRIQTDVSTDPARVAEKVCKADVVERSHAKVLNADSPLPKVEDGFTCMTYNVLLPNSQDGWWIYKYYRNPGDAAAWPARQALLRSQILGAAPDIVCLQEVSDLSFADDFSFMIDAGYTAVLHDKKGRMRPALFWQSSDWEKLGEQHKDRTLIVALSRKAGSRAGSVLFVVSAHLTAGWAADRRLRQVHEALETIAKESKRLGLDSANLPILFCGDFNSQGATAVNELLVRGVVEPTFREAGDPTERGQEGKQLTSKTKRHTLSLLTDAAQQVFGEHGEHQLPTIIAENIDSKMLHEDGTPTREVIAALDTAFDKCCSNSKTVMTLDDTNQWLLKINKEVGRGSEYRAAEKAFEERGEQTLDREAFRKIYFEELAEGKFWGVEHDLRALIGQGLAVPSGGPCELRFDYLYYTASNLQLIGVRDPLTAEQRRRIWGETWEVLPNEWHPSDHLPVMGAFAFC